MAGRAIFAPLKRYRTTSRKTMVLMLIITAMLGSVVVPAPAAAQEQPAISAFQTSLEHRFTAATAVYEVLQVATKSKVVREVSSADANLRASVGFVNGNRITSREAFDLDRAAAVDLEQALVHANKKSPQSVVDGIEQALVALAAADRAAAVYERDGYLALVEDASDPDVVSTLRTFDQKLAKADSQVDKGHYRQSIQFSEQAWTAVNGAFSDYWTQNDADGDLLLDSKEIELGLDPNNPDTDGDQLGDLVELLNTLTDPASANTYDPEIRDDAFDTDSDGLTNLAEVIAGTDPIEPDTDGDGLLDGLELNEFGSDPLIVDTDGDRLEDDSEYRIGTDPRNPDSNGNGVLDGDEVYTTQLDAASVTMSITGVGDVAQEVVAVDVTAEPLFVDAVGVLSPVIDFSTETAFSEAELTFTFDPAIVPDADFANVAVAYFDEAEGLYVPLPTVVDPATGTATATTDHFTPFVLFYVPNWVATFTGFGFGSGPGEPGDTFFDVALILDSSGSMTSNDPQGLRRTAAKSFVDGLIDGDQVAVVDFDSRAVLRQGLTSDFTAAKAAIDLINSSGGTNIGRGVSAAHNELLNNGDPFHAKVEILLTDGQGNYSSSLTTQAAQNDIVMYTIGLGSGVDATLLQGIATATNGQYFAVQDAADLPDVFSRIGGELGDQDTDGDGLLDRWETEGMPTGSGRIIATDPNNPDSDGDGMPDGFELVPLEPSPEWARSGLPITQFFRMYSDPTNEDTDGDSLIDTEELDYGLNPLDPDNDNDGANDGYEFASAWDLDNPNPDGDRFNDGEELAGGTDPFVFDPSLGDRTRALAAGAILGELGFFLADRGVSTTLSILWIPIPTLNTGFGALDLCNIPFTPCTELVSFQPILTEQIEYVIGMIVLTLVPGVDLLLTLRDTIGAALQGEYGWAIFELVAGLVGVLAPGAGDAVNAAGDLTKWLNRISDSAKRASKLDEAIAIIARTEWIGIVRKPIIKFFKSGEWDDLATRGMADADILRLLGKGRRTIDEFAEVFRRADEVKSAGRWFDPVVLPLFKRGKEAEAFLQSAKNGQQVRYYDDFPGRSFREVDTEYVDDIGQRVAGEAKTGDGAFGSRHTEQIRKDLVLRDQSTTANFDVIEWNFFPSGNADNLGPDLRLLEQLQDAGIRVVIWTP